MNTIIEAMVHKEEITLGDKPSNGFACKATEEEMFFSPGLTKREYFASQALNGLVSSIHSKNHEPQFKGMDNIAMYAVQAADCLIEELNKNKG